ncbi:Fic family protein [Kocuria sp. CCUG 69068]|uniref:Fic family protein n=1 Tax=Kocuria sp. CCUG 69068 TaxID=2043138 RepID=UPI001E511D28
MRPLAHHCDQVNDLHPFREGNGRTQRFVFDQVAVAADGRHSISSARRFPRHPRAGGPFS